jgi:hypothetical protein
VELERLRQAALATLQLQRAFEDLLRNAERNLEKGVALASPDETTRPADGGSKTVQALYSLINEGLVDLTRALETDTVPDLDAARAREIRLNALEMETRQALLAVTDGESRAISLRLIDTDLVNAYENVGNYVYRLCEALASEVDQDLGAAL